jgi:hypothetical protein
MSFKAIPNWHDVLAMMGVAHYMSFTPTKHVGETNTRSSEL